MSWLRRIATRTTAWLSRRPTWKWRTTFSLPAWIFAISLLAAPALAQLCTDLSPVASAQLGPSALSRLANAPGWDRVSVAAGSTQHVRVALTLTGSGSFGIGGVSPRGARWAHPQAGGEAIFVATDNGALWGLQPGGSLSKIWEASYQRFACTNDGLRDAVFHARLFATPAFKAQYSSDLVYSGTVYSSLTAGGGSCSGDNTDNRVTATNAATGVVQWEFNLLGTEDLDIVSGLVLDVDADLLFVTTERTASTSQDSVWAIDVLTGTKAWSVNAGRIQTAPILHDGRLYVATLAGDVKALDPVDGSEIWSVPSSLPYTIDPVLVEQLNGDILILTVDFFGRLRVVRDDGSSGSSVHYITLPGSFAAVSTPIADNMGHALIGAGDGGVYPIDLVTGAVGTPLALDSPTATVTHMLLEPPGLFATPASFLAGTSEGLLARYCTTLGAPPAVPALGPHGLAALLALLLGAGTLLRQRARR
jgi:outer membrane protein assembly factor BamB